VTGGGCYVPNGIFIAACHACGFVLEPPGACSLNPHVGFAKADLPRVSQTECYWLHGQPRRRAAARA
jgi:hypothetical protein